MTGGRPAVRRAGTDDAQDIVEILSSGFELDPPLLWILADPAERRALTPRFFEPFVDLVLAEGQAHITEDRTGAALWLDVDTSAEPVDDQGAFREAFTKALGDENARRFFVLDELFTANHPSHESHAYLLFAGVRRENQEAGIGSVLLAHHLAELDRTERPAYLEASSARNAALYRRLGFTSVNEGLSLPDGPTLYPMWRRPLPGQTST
jgi:ribosomal protein S18 acetylase RimI-like enzyme